MTRAEGVWIWLSRVRGLGAGRARQLVEFFGGEEALLAAQEPELREAVGEALALLANAVAMLGLGAVVLGILGLVVALVGIVWFLVALWGTKKRFEALSPEK